MKDKMEVCCGWVDDVAMFVLDDDELGVKKGGRSIDGHGRRWDGWAGLRSRGRVVYLLLVFDVQYVNRLCFTRCQTKITHLNEATILSLFIVLLTTHIYNQHPM
jgi:hypothetical protein